MPYYLAEDALVTMRIYNTDGNFVRQLDMGEKSVGAYATRETAAYWDGRSERGEALASGLYFYRLSAGEFPATRRMLLLK